MKHSTLLEGLLRPLEVYAWDNGGFQRAEIVAVGAALDEAQDQLERIEQEMLVTTAKGEGLERIAALLRRRPTSVSQEALRSALAALLRIGDGSFTLAALQDAVCGCGVAAILSEGADPCTVEIRFPGVGGIPEQFAELSCILEDILPCHLDIQYIFNYLSIFAIK